MCLKKGQITIFTIIGLVIISVVSIIIYFSIEKQPKVEQLPFEYAKVESFITGCLDEALTNGVAYCASGNRCPYYEEDLGGQVVTSFLGCTGARGEKIQEQFPYYKIEVGNVGVNIVRSESKIEASLSFPVLIKKDGAQHMLNIFKSEYILKSGGCIPCPACDENCITQEEIKASILDVSWTIPPGGFVGLKEGECLAC